MTDRNRWAWARLNAYGIILAGLALLGGLDLINPGGTDFARLLGEVPPGQHVWATEYVAAGILMLYGFARTDRRAETAGLALLTGGLILQLAVAVWLIGLTDFTLTRVAILALVAGCAWARYSALWSQDGLTISIPPRDNA